MTNFKNEFLNNYNYMDIENYNTHVNAEDETPNGIKENQLMDNIFDYAIKNNLYSYENWETIGGVFNKGNTLKIEIHNVETDEKRYINI